MKTFERLLVWPLILAQVGWAVPVGAAAPTRPVRSADAAAPAMRSLASPSPPTIQPNRRVPSVKPVPLAPTFSATPTAGEIYDARVFEEPLVPVNGTPTPEETQALARALGAYLDAGSGENVGPLVAFLEGRAVSVWRASLQLNLGLVYLRTGYYSRAVRSLEEAFAVSKSARDQRGRAVADRALGELIRLTGRLGMDLRLEELLREAEGRDVGGSAAEMVEQGKQGLWLMRNHPERALRCGPVGIDRILAFARPGQEPDPRVVSFPASPRHHTASDEEPSVGREPRFPDGEACRSRAAFPAPSLIHWTVGHFAALLKVDDHGLLISDAVFGATKWMRRRVVDDEASGYALVPTGRFPSGWRSVDDGEAETIWGWGPDRNNPKTSLR
jgi:hypothetical protein